MLSVNCIRSFAGSASGSTLPRSWSSHRASIAQDYFLEYSGIAMLKAIGFSHDTRAASHDAKCSLRPDQLSNFPEWWWFISINNTGNAKNDVFN
jgi:hypothetical protein